MQWYSAVFVVFVSTLSLLLCYSNLHANSGLRLSHLLQLNFQMLIQKMNLRLHDDADYGDHPLLYLQGKISNCDGLQIHQHHLQQMLIQLQELMNHCHYLWIHLQASG